MIRRLSIGLGIAATILLTTGTGAWASESHQAQFVTVVWEMPTWDVINNQPVPTWPQTLFAHSDPTDTSEEITLPLPSCGQVQIDVYRYTTYKDQSNVDALLAAGVLTAPNQPYPEPVVSARLLNLGTCETPSPTPTPTPTPAPTPSESKTPTPSPTQTVPTEAPSTHAPTPSPTCEHSESVDCLAPTGGPGTSYPLPAMLAAGVGLLALGTLPLLRRKGNH